MTLSDFAAFFATGGPALWVIGVLSVLTVAIGLWKIVELIRLGIWRSAASHAPKTPTGRVVQAAQLALQNPRLDREMAVNETTRVAKTELFALRQGIRPLELIAAIAPLVGLLGTVMGMISAFQALQNAGGSADPSVLAGGIWEALLTTAAGMAVAIPASVLASWCEGITEREQARMEDRSMRVFNDTAPVVSPQNAAA